MKPHNDFDNMLTRTSKLSTAYFEVGHGYVVYQIKETQKYASTLRTGTVRETTNTMQGIATLDEVFAYVNGEADKVSRLGTLVLEGQNLHVMAVRPEYVKVVRTEGFHAAEEQSHLKVEQPFTVLSDDLGPVEFIAYYSDNKLFRLDGTPLPMALHFDYMDGYTKDTNLDMEKAVEILKARDDIRFTPSYRDFPYSGGFRHRVKEVDTIPYYNRDRDATYFLNFVWTPNSQEEYQRVWDAAQKYKTKHYTFPGREHLYQALFEMDYFGLRAAGADKRKTFYGNG